MRARASLLPLLTIGTIAGCDDATTIGTSRTFDDASTSTGGSNTGTGGAPSGTGDATSAPGGSGGAPEAGSCGDSAWNAVQSGGSPLLDADAASNTPPPLPIEAGRPPGLPPNPCGVKPLPACSSGPRAIFSCPEISGATAPRHVAPGDVITVKVPVSDDGNDNYACTGIESDPPLENASVLSHAVKPAYVQLTGRVPSLPSGSFIHFTASVSGARYPGGTACAGDLTQFEFDIMVFAPR